MDQNYRLGPGDQLVLILTGDVERSHTLEVTREGFVVIPQVGQVYVANLTLGQLEDQLYGRLGRVYSGVRRGPNATTRFQLSIARLRTIQVYVAGDVVRPGAYQMSSAGTVLTALYAAGGPTTNGSFRYGSRSVAAAPWWTASTSTSICCAAATPPTSGSRAATWCSSRCTAARARSRAGSCGRRSTRLLPGRDAAGCDRVRRRSGPQCRAGPGDHSPDPAARVTRPRRAGARGHRGRCRPVHRRRGARAALGLRPPANRAWHLCSVSVGRAPRSRRPQDPAR